ncbi:hypothetical protein [Spiroplasma taiwanense]|uniref:hypothetical protein n=1 Tax=Spiroplasma taiwanense TaxID=2145 RepID=UPI00040C0EA0|nr:hypothetical protein [Spiroplasma taiwanense]
MTFNNLLLIKKLKTNGYNFSSLLEYDLETIQIDNLEYDFKYVYHYKSIGYLNRDKKTNKSTKSGSNGTFNVPGFRHNSH